MVEAPRLPQGSGSAEQTGKGSSVDPDKFRDLMKVDKTDDELKKKKKSRGQAEEENKAKSLPSTPSLLCIGYGLKSFSSILHSSKAEIGTQISPMFSSGFNIPIFP